MSEPPATPVAPAPERTGRRLLRSLIAVLAGNAIYFVLLLPHLPQWLRHRPMKIDAGLAFDFVICLVLYIGLGRVMPGRPRP